jgi:hypothetical protein
MSSGVSENSKFSGTVLKWIITIRYWVLLTTWLASHLEDHWNNKNRDDPDRWLLWDRKVEGQLISREVKIASKTILKIRGSFNRNSVTIRRDL